MSDAQYGQMDDRAEVLGVVQRAFDALDDGDEQTWGNLLLEDGIFSSVRDVNGARRIQTTTFGEHVARATAPNDDRVFLERMWEPTVLIDGDLAVVWTRYDFHLDGEFSHCGTDGVLLLRTDDGWRIASLAWTTEQDCEPSPLGPPPGA